MESTDELTRQIIQQALITKVMGGPLAEQSEDNLEYIFDVLDVSCGSGGWALQVANSYPEMTVVGIDHDFTALSYATALASLQNLTNAQFQHMDVTHSLKFQDKSFHLVNVRCPSRFLTPDQWSSFLHECLRILHPGGIVRMTEEEQSIVTTSASSLARLIGFGLDALYRAGRSFSPDGRHRGTTPLLLHLLRAEGFQGVECRGHALDHSYGSALHTSFVAESRTVLKSNHDFILSQNLSSPEELAGLYEQALVEMQSEDFAEVVFLLTVWGKRPL